MSNSVRICIKVIRKIWRKLLFVRPIILNNCLKISTLYSAKGLDFKVSFFCGISEGLIQHLGYNNSKKLIYVGMTRAIELLYITYSVNNELTKLNL
ncbi:MAG: 3'-5' exonuclease [Bacillota bacterium]|nr:3'-5' exonuclease [Bacillota bacterium]